MNPDAGNTDDAEVPDEDAPETSPEEPVRPEDDEEVPPKQIHRWKNEGGSWLPTD